MFTFFSENFRMNHIILGQKLPRLNTQHV